MTIRRALLLTSLLALAVWAGSPVGSTVTSTSGTGVNPPTITSGVRLQGATSIRVRLSSSNTGTITGGKTCAFYLPAGSTLASQWVRSPALDLTLPSSATELDAGVVRSLVLPDLVVVGQYGRVSYVPCGVTGTADDGGVINTSVTTEAWGPAYP